MIAGVLVAAAHLLLLALLLVTPRHETVPVAVTVARMLLSEPSTPAEPAPPLPPVTLEQPRIDLVLPPMPPIEIETQHFMAPPAAGGATSPPAPAAAPQATPGSDAITAPRFDADYLSNPAPEYPTLSRRLREQGTVLLRVLVAPTGTPVTVQLERTSGFARLDNAALRAVQRWRFVPARRGGDPVEAWVLVPLDFALTS